MKKLNEKSKGLIKEIGKREKERGITLIALIVTIVVMLILAGITISIITKSGIFGKAKFAVSKYKEAQDNEASALSEAEKKMQEEMEKYSGNGSSDPEANLPENTKSTKEGTIVKTEDKWKMQTVSYVSTSGSNKGKEIEIADTKKVATVYGVAVGDGNTVPVPYGFYYVGGTLNDGVIISDNKADAYDGKVDKTTHEYAVNLKGNQFVWIPCSASDYHKTNWGKASNSWSYDIDDAGYQQCQKYGGFYIGRYEAGVATLKSENEDGTGNWNQNVTFANDATLINGCSTGRSLAWRSDGWWYQNKNFTARGTYPLVSDFASGNNKATGNVVFKANAVPYYHADFYTAREMAARMYNGSNCVATGLVTGTQWDVMLNKIQSSVQDTSVTSSDWGNYSDSGFTSTGYGATVNTGSESAGVTGVFKKVTDKAKNSTYVMTTGSSKSFLKYGLYDVAGNLWEWTEEQVSTNNDSAYQTYMHRGGSFGDSYSDYPACYRYDHEVAHTGTSGRFSFHTLHKVRQTAKLCQKNCVARVLNIRTKPNVRVNKNTSKIYGFKKHYKIIEINNKR